MTTTPHRRIRSLWQFSALLLLALALLPAAAFATAQPKAANCLIYLEPSRNGQESAKRDGPCFETLAEAVAAATGNRVQLPKSASPADIDAALRADEARASGEAGTTGDYPLSIEYEYRNYAGDRLLIVGETTCAAGDYLINLPSAWNNRISSASGYYYCNRVRHFQYPNGEGMSILCAPACATMGEMNNRTSSLRLRYVP